MFLQLMQVQAQAPGYQGKRSHISYSNEISYNPLYFIGSDERFFHFSNKLNFDYTYSTVTSAGLSYHNRNNGYYKGNLMVHTAGIYIKFFRRGLVAPVGPYFKTQLSFIAAKVNASDTLFSQVFLSPGLNFTLGKQYVIAKRIMLNFSMFTGFPTWYIQRRTFNTEDENEKRARNIIAASSLFGLEIGLGVIY